MPIPVLEAFAANRGMVEAERQLMRVNATALGSGAVKDADRMIARLERQAAMEQTVKPKTLGDLRAAGFAVREVRKER